MINPTVVFSHGQESGPWGTKINAMSKEAQNLGFEVESIDYQGISDPTERVQKLEKFCSKLEKSPVLIGSSMGGYVATAAAMNVNAMLFCAMLMLRYAMLCCATLGYYAMRRYAFICCYILLYAAICCYMLLYAARML